VGNVKELVVTPSDVAVRREQDEYHSDTSNISADGSRSCQKVDIVGREQTTGVDTSTALANRIH
jgi:hypothetical protein